MKMSYKIFIIFPLRIFYKNIFEQRYKGLEMPCMIFNKFPVRQCKNIFGANSFNDMKI